MIKKNILLINDDPLILLPLLHFLIGKGFDVVSTNSPSAALSLIQMNKFDVVITDLNMKPVSGSEIVRHIRKSDFSGKIILISGGSDAGNELPIDAFFKKPFDLSDVYEKIREWVE